MRAVPTALQSLMVLGDEELVSRVLGGDGPAFELLMRRHNQRLFRVARAVVGNDGEAEEVVQDAYVRAYAGLARFEHRSSVATWLSRIALHEALRSRRRSRRTRTVESRVLDEVAGRGGMDGGGVGGDTIDRSETRAMLRSTLDSLPTGLRAVVMLRLVEGLSTRETAQCLRLSEASVKVGLHRARRMMAETLEQRAVADLREEFGFASHRCDRIVAGVFERLGRAANDGR